MENSQPKEFTISGRDLLEVFDADGVSLGIYADLAKALGDQATANTKIRFSKAFREGAEIFTAALIRGDNVIAVRHALYDPGSDYRSGIAERLEDLLPDEPAQGFKK